MTPAARRRLVAVHRVAGLALAWFFVLEAVTGTALLYRTTLDRLADPAAHRVTACARAAPLDASLRAAAAALRAAPAAVDWAAWAQVDTLRVTAPDGGLLGNRLAYVDACTARVVAVRRAHLTASGLAVDLHDALALGGDGALAVCALGAGLALFAITGVALWPGLPAGLRLRRGARTYARAYDLHVALGILAAAFLAVLGVSGAAMAEYGAAQNALHAVLRDGEQTGSITVRRPARPASDPLQRGLDAATSAYRGAQPTELDLAAAPGGAQSFYVKRPEEADVYGASAIYTDPYTGRRLATDDGLRMPPSARIMKAMLPLHMMTPWGRDLRVVPLGVSLAVPLMVATGLVLQRVRAAAARRAALARRRRDERPSCA